MRSPHRLGEHAGQYRHTADGGMDVRYFTAVPPFGGWGGDNGNVATKRLSFERLSFEMGLCIAQTQESQGTLAKHTWFLGIALHCHKFT